MLHRRIPLTTLPRSARALCIAALACGGSPESGSLPERSAASTELRATDDRDIDVPGSVARADDEAADDDAAPDTEDHGGADESIEATAALPEAPRRAFVDATAGQVEALLGIPYAQPPVGPRRFQPPEPLTAPATEKDATGARTACLQVDGVTPRGSEDCLYLNVYRPTGTTSASNLPVMVWIHGGSFLHGAGIDYDPQRLVDQNQIVVVTINYRLGALGFLALPATAQSAALSGNYGLMDQQEALSWVRKNIATFGGNPNRVTIQGQSAGGGSVCAHLASPPAAGLFSQAVIQSGGCSARTLADTEAYGAAFARLVPGCEVASDAAECLRRVNADEIRKTTGASVAAALGWLFGPVVSSPVLPKAPADVVQAKEQHRVPVLIGGIRDEKRAFMLDWRERANTNYPNAAAAYFKDAAIGAEVVRNYPEADFTARFGEAFPALTAAASDLEWACGTALLADWFSSSTTTYAYELDDPEFSSPDYISPVLGATHSADLPFLFEAVLFGAGISNRAFDEEQNALAAQMVSAWGAFIKTGNPSTDVPWASYSQARRTMLRLVPGGVAADTEFAVRHKCAAWGFPGM